MCACFASDIFGDGCLDSGDSQCKREGQHRRDQLVDSHSFRPECIGQKDTVEEADKSTEQTCQRQCDSSGHEWVFPFLFHNTPS